MASCREKPAASSAVKKPAQTNQQIFAVKGLVKRLEAEGQAVVIQHEEIPNYMAAMTMPFSVKDTNDLRAVRPGQSVTFRLHVTEDESWIDQIAEVGAPKTNDPPERPSVRVVREVQPLKEGDPMPDYRFTNELGQAVSLSDFKGHALALTFIFTRCPLPEFCPLMSRNFSLAQQQLASSPGAPTNWHLLTISFDPHFDTPAVLRSYAQIYRRDARRWSFVTGALIDIDAITEQFELPVIKQGETFEHKLRTVVIDAVGRIQKVFMGNKWTAEELADEIRRAAAANPARPPPPQ
ncbi:MAG: SCO family protein [Verrucomicrobia bacterium]|nr:SCO family protein [Verrucomicrobiota bacterium]